jgi:hypothetical protein
MRHRSGQPTTRETIGLFRLMDQTLNGRCPMKSRFKDRRDAGRKLATMLTHYANDPRVIVLALPRGGVPVAVEVATVLGAELDILTVRKLGVPGQEELAMGAVASGGVRVLDESLIRPSTAGLPSSSMTASPPAQRCAPPSARYASERRCGSWPPRRSARG